MPWFSRYGFFESKSFSVVMLRDGPTKFGIFLLFSCLFLFFSVILLSSASKGTKGAWPAGSIISVPDARRAWEGAE